MANVVVNVPYNGHGEVSRREYVADRHLVAQLGQIFKDQLEEQQEITDHLQETNNHLLEELEVSKQQTANLSEQLEALAQQQKRTQEVASQNQKELKKLRKQLEQAQGPSWYSRITTALSMS